MAIGTYTELQAAVASWVHRSDLTSVIQDCIALAEERFNRQLRTRHQETALADTAIDASYQIAIPADTVAVKRLWRVDGSLQYELQVETLGFVEARQGYGGLAASYSWGASNWDFDGTGTVGGTLIRNIPPLSSNSTNWLLTGHPSAYLYATLAEVMGHARDTEGLALWDGRADGKIAEINRIENRNAQSGPLRVRVNAYTP